MKKNCTLILALALCLTCAAPVYAADYAIPAPEDHLFGKATSLDEIHTEEEPANADRSKSVALIPPAFGSPTSYLPGSGDYLTPNLVPGALDGGLVAQLGEVNYPAVDASASAPSTSGVTVASTRSYSAEKRTAVMSDLYYSGGYLATLKIPAIDVNVKVYQGTDSSTLAKGAGHFEETSIWDGNCCIAGHNRGASCYFGRIHELSIDDRITLTTKLGTRTYAVTGVSKIGETDRSGLAASADNTLTLYTCVRDQSGYRWCVKAAEIAA